MTGVRRKVLFLVVCGLILGLTACSSNNQGKIVGKWKASAAEFGQAAVPGGDVAVVYEFTTDNRFTISAMITVAGHTETTPYASGKYSLGSGNNVFMSDITPPIEGKAKSRERIAINGDSMTIDGEGGKKISLTRMK